MIGKVQLAGLVGLVGLVGGLFAVQAWKVNRIEQQLVIALADNATLKQAAQWQNQAVERLETELETASTASRELATSLAEANKVRLDALSGILDAKGRLHDATLEKPGLVERRVNDGLDDIMRRIAAATGNPHDPATD